MIPRLPSPAVWFGQHPLHRPLARIMLVALCAIAATLLILVLVVQSRKEGHRLTLNGYYGQHGRINQSCISILEHLRQDLGQRVRARPTGTIRW